MQSIAEDIYYLICGIRDPEFPKSLEELGVVRPEYIKVEGKRITIFWRPTVQHCAFAF